MKSYNFLLLRNENNDFEGWISASKKFDNINLTVVNITCSDWYERIIATDPDLILTRPPGITSLFKQLYDERISILREVLHVPFYPNFLEIQLYENKKYLSYWLKSQNIPHPLTTVSYYYKEAEETAKRIGFPIVAKSNLGASGSGVVFLRKQEEIKKYLREAFFKDGKSKRWGPDLSKGQILQRGLRLLIKPKSLKKKITLYKARQGEKQKGFIIFQKFIPHDYEWRAVRIGNSFFAHKKIVKGEKSSGALIKEYTTPPESLLDFVKSITDRYDFRSVAIDLFEISKDNYLVNEVQCMFGQRDPYQMLVNNQPGRYRYLNGKWIFEEGNFAANQCFDLRLEHAVQSLVNGQH